MEGIVLGNRYELLEKIGEGGMSQVFKARDNKLNRFVAVKILKKEFCNNADIVEKFMGEATAIATLSDNNIVNVLDVGTQADDINYIVMEYVNGKTLKDVIKQVGKMNYETGISVAIQIAKALDCAHRNKIIHRDVKPQNILVTEDGVMKVTDFGIAKSSTSSTITNTSTIMGSAHYLSPEQAKGSFIDCRTDLYSLGVVLYEMVTGVVPFQGDSAVTIALKHIQEDVVPPKTLNSKIPDSLNTLILKAMEKEPSKRYQTAKEMIADLQKIKNNPNAIIGDDNDDNEHTIIMSAVSEEMTKQKPKETAPKATYSNDEEDDDYYYDDDYDDDDSFFTKKKSMIKKILLGVVGIVLVIALGVGGYKLLGNRVKEVTVPNLVGMNVDEAKSTLESMNLVLVEAGTEESDEQEGTVIKSNIEAGTKVKENSQIRVIVSGGAAKIKMPDLVEDDLDTAKTILSSYKLKISSTSEEYSSNIPKGKIIRQTPAKDTDVDENTEITVVISKGAKVVKNTVPNVVGMSVDNAQNKMSNSGFGVSISKETTNDKDKDGIVLSQSVGAGDSLAAGKTIKITVGEYKEPEKPQTKPETKPDNNTNNNTNTNNNSDKDNSDTKNNTNNSNNNGQNNKEEVEKPNSQTTAKPSGDENSGGDAPVANNNNNNTTNTDN
ncbi:MAG TPA: Stk1 family PASTA domain-containing Ser/Thr kinase [Clostridium sp.]|nr:Stk1 family PASTA domain-containing Ser/Thr kinase [Clostridium sp.]